MHHRHDHQPDLHDSVCTAIAYLVYVDEELDVCAEDIECTRSLSSIIGSLAAVHDLMVMGAILSPDMEDFINGLLAEAWVWCEDHDCVPNLEGAE